MTAKTQRETFRHTPCLYIEAVKLRPTALAVLEAIASLEDPSQGGDTLISIERLAGESRLSPHVVRARLCELRRLGLVDSLKAKRLRSGADRCRRTHAITTLGRRRLKTR